MKSLLIALIGIVALAQACDVEIYVQSNTARQFSVQIIAPNGQRSERWTFNRQRQRNTFGQDAGVCVVGDWVLESYGPDNILARTVRVNLDGTGRVVYNVDDDLDFLQVENHGLICNGQCATSVSGSRSFSRTGSRTRWD